MSSHLADVERAVIARVRRETGMLLDTAATLQDNISAYTAAEQILMQRARDSADPDDDRRIGVILRPFNYLPGPVAQQFRISALGTDLARLLYRALAGQAPRGYAAIMATASVTGPVQSPPYEPVTSGLSRDDDRLPPGARPQARRW